MVKTLHFHCKRAWVQFLVREISSHMLHGAAKSFITKQTYRVSWDRT